ncbi:MAG TPA: AbrB/MazE/SpoVT family DNA-binding domain-containing protein [Verrucomicrobiales bacterium]|nr:AbrB/MazE/SpoVT family DNA-binding domain-containing protein [Verrucomicrobiales bacterium]
MTMTISAKGQITVPVEIREALGLTSGTKIEVELGPKGSFIARKATEGSFFAQLQAMAKDAKVPYRDSREAMNVLRGQVEEGDVD